MPKINFSKVEGAFDNALKKLFIDRLSELATIANLAQDTSSQLSKETIQDVMTRFRKELKKLKKHDAKLFAKLNLSVEEEKRFMLPVDDYSQSDWLNLKALKERIDELKHDLYGEEVLSEENEKQVTTERRRHINKRFNIRDGWLPLR